MGPAGVYYDPIKINSGGKYVEKNIYKSGTSYLLSFDWNYISMHWQEITSSYHKYKEFENEYNEPSELKIYFKIFSVNYVWNF